jgi:thioredoxin-dependent peroxiredoxin
MEKFVGAGAQILGISVNRSSTNKGFAEKIGVNFPLLSDAEKKVSRQYGVLNFFGVANRTTFVVDKEGIIRHIDRASAAANPAGAHQACGRLADRAR